MPTVAEVLELPVLARGLPQVVAGRSSLDRRIRWVHVLEWASPATALRGSELVLTTGLGFPVDLNTWAAELADVHAAGVVLELGRHYREAPEDLVQACRRRALPFVVLRRGVKFVDVTQEVHSIIIGGQLNTLREALRIHDTFTSLTVRGAEAHEVVSTAAGVAKRAMVLENLSHQALICEPIGQDLEHVLNRWEARSRATPTPSEGTTNSGPENWLVTSVEFRGERLGRLVMLPHTTDELAFRTQHTVVLERAALALTTTRLAQKSTWERQAHGGAFDSVIRQQYRSIADITAQLTALGVPVLGRCFFVMIASLRSKDHATTASADKLARDLADAGVATLLSPVTDRRLGLLVSFRPEHDWRQIAQRVATTTRHQFPSTTSISAGTPVSTLSEARRSYVEASQIAQALPPRFTDRLFFEASDIGLPELLYSMRDDLRLQTFAERRLATLLDYDSQHGTDLFDTLRIYLEAAGNKSAAAGRANLSRQAFYRRLGLVQELLGFELEDGAHRADLHLAVGVIGVQRNRGLSPERRTATQL